MSPAEQPGNGPNWEAVVEGEIRFPEGSPPFLGATVRVSLLDVTRADAPSRPVAEQTIRDFSHQGGAGGGVRFALRGERLDVRTRYEVRVHVDVDGDGKVSRGDYITTESYPVLTFGHPDRVTIRVRRVGP